MTSEKTNKILLYIPNRLNSCLEYVVHKEDCVRAEILREGLRMFLDSWCSRRGISRDTLELISQDFLKPEKAEVKYVFK